MFCRNCGNEVKDGEYSCPACGTPVAAEQPQAPQQPSAPQYQQPQYQAPQQPYAPQYQVPQQPVQGGDSGKGMAIPALIFAICSLVFFWVPYVNAVFLVLAILSIIFGVKARGKAVASGNSAGLATTAFILGIVGTVFCFIGTSCYAFICAEACSEVDDIDDIDDIYDSLDDFDDYYDYYY